MYVNIRGPGPVVDSKAVPLLVPGEKTNDEIYELMRSIFQGLIDEKCGKEVITPEMNPDPEAASETETNKE